MTIEKIIKLNSDNFGKWDSSIQEYIDCKFHLKEYNTADKERIFFQTNDLLFEIAENFFRYGNFKDDWDTSKGYLNIDGQNLLLKSLKINNTFEWGVDNNKFYLRSYLLCSENIRYMKDDFWETLLGLKKYANFKFVENAVPDSRQRQQFENKTSNVFRLIRNYMLFQIDNFNSTEYRKSTELDLGWFELHWEFGSDWTEVLEMSCRAFKDLYRLNYQLWKITDLKNKKR